MYANLKRMKAPALAIVMSFGALQPAGSEEGMDYQTVTDLLHLVMSSDRTVYTRMIVNRLAVDENVIKASEHFVDDKALVLPA